ncbi:MAG: hypothetical protein ABI330_09925 [Caldimonas sp.]
MNFITIRSIAVASTFGVASIASLAQTTAPAPCSGTVLSAFQKHVVAKSEQGVDALRDYLFITRGIYNVSMDEAVAMLDRQREARRSCMAVAATDTRR